MSGDQSKHAACQVLGSGLAYGLGLVLGQTLGFLVADSFSLVASPDQESGTSFLLVGIFLALLIYGLSGAVGGFAGGWSLPLVSRQPSAGNREGAVKKTGRWGYAWQGAISLGVPYGTFLLVATLLTSLLSFYYVSEIPRAQFATQFMLVGALFGALSGLLLGIVTVGWRRSGRVVLAALIGFGLGGALLGLGLRGFLVSVTAGDLASGRIQFLVLGLLSFGFLGGSALGLVYSHMSRRPATSKLNARSRLAMLIAAAVVVISVVLVFNAMRPVLAQLRTVLAPRDAGHSNTLASDAVGTHWSDPVTIASSDGKLVQPALAAAADHVALVWFQENGNSTSLVYQSGTWTADNGETRRASPLTVHDGSAQTSAPQVALDGTGASHIIWRDGALILYARCQAGRCEEPVTLSAGSEPGCEGALPGALDPLEQPPAIGLSRDDRLMAVWHGTEGALRYANWPASGSPGLGASGCVLANGVDSAVGLQLAGGADGRFTLVYGRDELGGVIHALTYPGNAWEQSAQVIGEGHSPQAMVDPQGGIRIAWCGEDEEVRYSQTGTTQVAAELPCQNRPELALDSNGRLHISWYSDVLTRTTGMTIQAPVIYEVIETEEGWSEPAIVAHPAGPIQPAMAGSEHGTLHVAWSDNRPEEQSLTYATQVQYDCEGAPLSRLAQVAYEVAQRPDYQPGGDIVPYCQNRFDRLLHTPGPDPAFSAEPQTPSGGFDVLADLIRTAEYEVLISTMEYSEDEGDDSPGSVIASAVADLYEQLSADPSRYPRGLTVRILLGNRPPLETLELNSLLWRVLSDLRDAGVPEMVNTELGWRLEVSNYEGAWPHSHAKITVVDGKTVVGAGFNMEYHHLPADHASGEGKGTVDVAAQVTGPVAQDGRRAFDELWEGATQRHCSELFPAYRLWRLSCRDTKATVDHVPEVMRYYLPGEGSTTFSSLRTAAYDEADQQAVAVMAKAEERIDVMHTMFTMPSVCILDYLIDVCSPRDAMPFMRSILTAVEQNGARARLLIDQAPIKGVENVLALDELMAEIEDRGLGDRVEIRAFPGPVHAKTTLIDDQFLIVGSHNFHWSAFGPGEGLAEYSLGVTDPQAIAEFQRLFEYHWQKAAPK